MTLIEALVALAFMGVITVGMIGLAIAVLNGNAKSRAITTAVHLAQDRLETIRNTAYDGITTDNFPADSPREEFQRTTVIQLDTPVKGVKRVVVTVSWTGGSSVREETLVSQ